MIFSSKKWLAIFLISIASLFLALSCASTKMGETCEHGGFSQKTLSNGIPVIFKQKKGSKIVVLKVLFEGGSSVIEKELGGIEDVVFSLMMRGSEKYPYQKLQQLEYEKSIFLSAGNGRDYSSAGFTCIQRDLELSLDMISECIKNPSFLEQDFMRKMTEIEDSIEKRKADPSGSLGLALSKEAFKNHPYETTVSVTEDSFKNINLDLVKEIHARLLNANRIKIFVAGDFSKELLLDFTSALDKNFGSIPKDSFPTPAIPRLKVTPKSQFIENEQAGDTGYAAGIFEYPERSSKDCVPLALALMYIDDLLFSQVREKAGALYSVGTDVIGGRKLLGLLSLYKISGKENLKKTVYDAILSFDEEAITKKLSQYKNQYVSSLFESAMTSSGMLTNVILGSEYFGSPDFYLKRAEQVQNVSARQVIAAYKKYIEPLAKEDKVTWIVVDGKENLSKYDF